MVNAHISKAAANLRRASEEKRGQAQSRRSDGENKIRELNGQIDNIKSELRVQETRRAAAMADGDSSQITYFTQEIQEGNRTVDDLNSQIDDERSRMDQEVQSMTQEADDLRREADDLARRA